MRVIRGVVRILMCAGLAVTAGTTWAQDVRTGVEQLACKH